jgi:hypothetical protein
MPASCPFCGTTLNFGLKFCVVCGRHTTSAEMTKLGGLKTGVKQAENTRRLEDSISSSDFEKTRKKATRFTRHIRSLGEQFLYVLIGVVLFFCSVRFTLQTWFPGKVHQLLAPILGKNTGVVEQTLTGKSTPVKDEDDEDAEQVKKEEVKPQPKPRPKAPKKTKNKVSRKRYRHKYRQRHTQNVQNHSQ